MKRAIPVAGLAGDSFSDENCALYTVCWYTDRYLCPYCERRIHYGDRHCSGCGKLVSFNNVPDVALYKNGELLSLSEIYEEIEGGGLWSMMHGEYWKDKHPPGMVMFISRLYAHEFIDDSGLYDQFMNGRIGRDGAKRLYKGG